MLSSPITVTIDGVDHSLSRINQDNFSSVFLKKMTGRELQLSIRHSYVGKAGLGQQERHNIELRDTTWAEDGTPSVRLSYVVMQNVRGTDPVPLQKDATGLFAFATTNVAAVTGWES